MDSHSGYLRLRELCTILGRPSDRTGVQALRRDLQRREEVLGVQILWPLSASPNSPLVTTLPTVRHHCPEMFDNRAEIVELVREYVQKIHEDLKGLKNDVIELKTRDSALAARIRANTSDLRDLRECVKVSQTGRTEKI